MMEVLSDSWRKRRCGRLTFRRFANSARTSCHSSRSATKSELKQEDVNHGEGAVLAVSEVADVGEDAEGELVGREMRPSSSGRKRGQEESSQWVIWR